MAEFLQNNFDGNGVYTYANGDRVDGTFKAGQLAQIVTLHQANHELSCGGRGGRQLIAHVVQTEGVGPESREQESGGGARSQRRRETERQVLEGLGIPAQLIMDPNANK